MSLFDPDVVVDLGLEEWEVFMRPIVADGGAQSLLLKLHDCRIPGKHRVVVPVALLDKAYSYAYAYGGGGFQDRFRVLVKAAIRTGLWNTRDLVEKPHKRGAAAFGRA